MNIKEIKTKEEFDAAVNDAVSRKCRVDLVRLKCYDCSAYSMTEVDKCTVTDCPLWHFRKGVFAP